MTNAPSSGLKPRKQRGVWYTSVITGMASYLDSASIVSSGIALVLYQQGGRVTANQIGILSAALTLGIAVGAATGGRLGDRFGRRPVFSVTMALIVAGAALLVFAPSFPLLLVGTAIVGLATGADLPVSIATISEAATDANRGKLVGFSQILWLFGIGGALLIGNRVGSLGHLGGQIMFAHIGIVAAVVLVLRQTIPESEVWLTARDERAHGLHTERAERARLKDLFKKPYLVPFVALLIFYPLVNLGANTGGQFGTFLWVQTAKSTVQFSTTIGLVMLGVGVILGLVFLRVVDTKLRMPFFYVGLVAYILSTVVPALIGVTVPTLIIWQLLSQFGGAFAFEAIMKVWTQESFPTLLRSTAQGTIICIARVVAAALALVTPALANGGPKLLFLALTAFTFVGMAAAVWGFRHGTRNEFDLEDQIIETAGVPA